MLLLIGSVSGQGTKIPQAAWCGKKKKKKKKVIGPRECPIRLARKERSPMVVGIWFRGRAFD